MFISLNILNKINNNININFSKFIQTKLQSIEIHLLEISINNSQNLINTQKYIYVDSLFLLSEIESFIIKYIFKNIYKKLPNNTNIKLIYPFNHTNSPGKY